MKSISHYKGLLLLIGSILLIVPEVLKVYYIMPFPGSQHTDHVALAYTLNKTIWISRITGGIAFISSLVAIYSGGKIWQKVTAIVPILIVAVIIYETNFVMQADHMFHQPEVLIMGKATAEDLAKDEQVLGIVIHGDARAYPIDLIGYHHQVRDTIGGRQVMVTYCTVCRTGMAYSPDIDGRAQTFRLVGMDQFNAMFEDEGTKSWWRQATGECCAGPLKGKKLAEIHAEQMTLRSWLIQHPGSKVMNPDPKFESQYAGLKGYSNGIGGGSLTRTDTLPFHPKSWTILVSTGKVSKGYDWINLRNKSVINDSIGGEPIVLVVDSDQKSFYCFDRKATDKILTIDYDRATNTLRDPTGTTIWDMSGRYISGDTAVRQLTKVNTYQEFYHSFRTFHKDAIAQ
jgi:hypothetical protein